MEERHPVLWAGNYEEPMLLEHELRSTETAEGGRTPRLCRRLCLAGDGEPWVVSSQGGGVAGSAQHTAAQQWLKTLTAKPVLRPLPLSRGEMDESLN